MSSGNVSWPALSIRESYCKLVWTTTIAGDCAEVTSLCLQDGLLPKACEKVKIRV